MHSKCYFGGLDLVRFFAACLVMLFHYAVVSWHLPISPNYGVAGAPDYPELSVFDIGWVGVEIFFVLSGFVIVQSADGKSAYQFLRGRAGRLLPAIWVCATITLGTVIFFRMNLLGPVLSSYLRTIFVYPNGPWISNVYWTLIVEIAFYAAIFLILLANAFKYIEAFAVVLIISSAIYIAGLIFLDWGRIHAYYLAQHGCFFGLGILFWLCRARGPSGFRVSLSIFALFACVLEICFVANGQLSGSHLWLAPLVWGVAVAAMYVSITLPGGGIKFTRVLGLMTFPLYLVHEKLGSGILRIAPISGRWAAMILAIVVVISVSFLVLKVEPLMRFRLERVLDGLVSKCVPRRILTQLNKRAISIAD
jgi:exopolysaccharide production protein ExoZ